VSAAKDPRDALLRWFLDGLDATQSVEGTLRNLVLDLRHSLASRRLEPDLRRELEQQLRLLEKAVGRVCQLQSRAADVLRTLREQPEETAERKSEQKMEQETQRGHVFQSARQR
jgi:hypothetical protein